MEIEKARRDALGLSIEVVVSALSTSVLDYGVGLSMRGGVTAAILRDCDRVHRRHPLTKSNIHAVGYAKQYCSTVPFGIHSDTSEGYFESASTMNPSKGSTFG